MSPTARLLVLLTAGALALGLAQPVVKSAIGDDGRLSTSDGDTVDVTDAARARGMTFAAGVTPADRAWIVEAVGRARPEAARLIGEVDGLIEVGTFADGGPALGVTRSHDRGFRIDLNTAFLNGRRTSDRATVVLHELGHAIDFALVPGVVNATLDAQVPRGDSCGSVVDCDLPEERFADTFAKWALHGAVSAAGAGYGIAMPASIEDWGAPLGRLAARLPAGASA